MHVLVVHDYGPLGKLVLERLRDTPLQVSPLLVSDPASANLNALENWIPEDTDPHAFERVIKELCEPIFAKPLILVALIWGAAVIGRFGA